MTQNSNKPIVIAGGGIGGLTAALGLAQKGLDVNVLERAPVLGEIGAGIQLGPNEFYVFDRLGVGDASRGMAVYVDKLQLLSRAIGEHIYHPAGAHAALRNSVMRAKSDKDWYDTLARLYEGTG